MSNTDTQTHTNVPTEPTVKKAAPDLSAVVPYVVTRNGIDYPLTPFAGRRGAWDGVIYQAPQVKVEEGKLIEQDDTFLNGLRFIGKDTVQRILNIFCKRFAQDAHKDAIPDEGENKGIFQLDKFLRSITEFSVAQLRISELRELYEEAVAQYQSASTEFIQKMMAAKTDEEKQAAAEWFQNLGKVVTQYKADLDERLAKKSGEAEQDTVRPE